MGRISVFSPRAAKPSAMTSLFHWATNASEPCCIAQPPQDLKCLHGALTRCVDGWMILPSLVMISPGRTRGVGGNPAHRPSPLWLSRSIVKLLIDLFCGLSQADETTRLALPVSCIEPVIGEQVLMRSGFYNPPLI